MPTTLAAIKNPLTSKALKEIAVTGGPAVTLFLPSEVPGGPNRRLSARIRKVADELETRCAERGFTAKESKDFLAPLRDHAEQIERETEGLAVAILRSPEAFRYFWLPRRFEQAVHVADNFHIRPVLDLLEGDMRFYILALAQKDLRLLACTDHSAEEVDLGRKELHNMVEFVATDQPDHNQRNATGPGGTSAGFSTNSDKERKDEYLYQYFSAVNKAVHEKLKDGKIPLVLAGVDYEIALYRKINTYAALCTAVVQSSANSLRGTELHTRGLECLAECRRERLDTILAQHDKQGGGVADAPVTEIVKAAYEGRVAHLLIGEGATCFGNFDDATHRVREHSHPAAGDEDLLNAASIQTILHAGEVHVLPDARIPGDRPAAAVMRYHVERELRAGG